MKAITVIALVCVLFASVHSQIVGPDEDNVTYFFFNNYSSVYALHGALPNLKFHPVLGGEEDPYIRLNNYAFLNFSTIEEVDTNGNVVAKVEPGTLTWTLTLSNDTDSETGNVHTRGALNTTLSNGLSIEVACESWSQGKDIPYGNYFNNVTADQAILSFHIYKWPFQSTSNRLDFGFSAGLDGPVSYSVSRSDSLLRANVSSSNTQFNLEFMRAGFLDNKFVPFTYRLSPATFTFYFQTGYFNESLYYDPNFAVLLKTQPDCSSLGGCSHGTCVEDNTCKCKSGYALPDCKNPSPSTTGLDTDPSYDNNNNNKNKVSNGVIIGVSVGACVVIVAVVVIVISSYKGKMRRQRKRQTTVNDH